MQFNAFPVHLAMLEEMYVSKVHEHTFLNQIQRVSLNLHRDISCHVGQTFVLHIQKNVRVPPYGHCLYYC